MLPMAGMRSQRNADKRAKTSKGREAERGAQRGESKQRNPPHAAGAVVAAHRAEQPEVAACCRTQREASQEHR